MKTLARFFRRWAELIREPDASSAGECQHCRAPLAAGVGLVANRTRLCSDYCAQQNEAVRLGW